MMGILRGIGVSALAIVFAVSLISCSPTKTAGGAGGKRTIVVTYSTLGSLVKDLVGDSFDVVVSMPNGLDPHEWEPSAQDMAVINKADLVVQNGLGLEGGMEKALAQAAEAKVPFFTATYHITVRTVKAGQGIPGDDEDQAPGASDPHLWLDPSVMKAVEIALAAEIKTRFDIDLSARASDLAKRLDDLDAEISMQVAQLPLEKRLLVTGHESVGYFAEHFGFILVGAIMPSLSSQAEVSAADLSALKSVMANQKVRVVFTEMGTPPKVAQALADELHIKAVEIGTHALPDDGSYFTMMRNLANTIVTALK